MNESEGTKKREETITDLVLGKNDFWLTNKRLVVNDKTYFLDRIDSINCTRDKYGLFRDILKWFLIAVIAIIISKTSLSFYIKFAMFVVSIIPIYFKFRKNMIYISINNSTTTRSDGHGVGFVGLNLAVMSTSQSSITYDFAVLHRYKNEILEFIALVNETIMSEYH